MKDLPAKASILFICKANQVRSPIAVALLKDKLRKSRSDWNSWQIESAGTWARTNVPLLLEIRSLLNDRGIPKFHHRSRLVTSEIMDEFNLILTMEPDQKEALQIEFPAYKNKIFTLSEMSGEVIPIDDPIGGSIENYLQTIDEIEFWIDSGINNIIKLASPT